MNNKINIYCCDAGGLRDEIRRLREQIAATSSALADVKAQISEIRHVQLPALREQLHALRPGADRDLNRQMIADRDSIRQMIQDAKNSISVLVRRKEALRAEIQALKDRINDLQSQLVIPSGK